MKALALALSVSSCAPAGAQLSSYSTQQQSARKRRPLYCRGDRTRVVLLRTVMTMPQGEGRLVKVATFLRGDPKPWCR